jgi:hypothetical protein
MLWVVVFWALFAANLMVTWHNRSGEQSLGTTCLGPVVHLFRASHPRGRLVARRIVG